jgi:hypothetical protein
VDVKWTAAATKSSLWRSYVEDVIASGGSVSDIKINEEDFPVTWKPTHLDSNESTENESTEKDLTIDRKGMFCGYSPFQECYEDNLNSGFVFKYMPTDSNASFSDDDDSYDETKSHEEVFVVENVPQNESSTPHNSSHDEIIDFNLIAEQALASLDADYNDTVQFDVDCNSQAQRSKSKSNEAFTEHSFSNENSLDFGAFKSVSEQNLINDLTPPFPEVNPIAVKSAMKNIKMKNSEAMNKKWSSWKPAHIEYCSFTVPESHEIIPSKPLATFRQHSEKAKAIATSLSKSATIADALQRMLKYNASDYLTENGTFVIHCIDASAVEYQSNVIKDKIFGPVIQWLNHYNGNILPSSFHVNIYIFGHEVPSHFEDEIYELPNSNNKRRLHSASITYKTSTYHDYIDKIQSICAETETLRPNMIIAFNPRFQYEPKWHSTLVKMFSMQSPTMFVVTACTMQDAEKDKKLLRSLVNDLEERCLWPQEVNSFCSRVEHQTISSSVSCYEDGLWQAFILR